jgi:hypothetical protein
LKKDTAQRANSRAQSPKPLNWKQRRNSKRIMTSKKRDDLPPVFDEEEPKRPRRDEQKQDSEEKADEPSSPAATGQGRGRRRDWLSFSGRRQPRIGNDFQAVLPKASSQEEGATISNDGSKDVEE